jgi:hypothetical protein
MTPTLLLTLVLAQSGPGIVYTAPAEGENIPVDKYEITVWEPGKELFLAVDLANVREKPEAEAAVLGTPDLGTPVTVQRRMEARVKVGDRVDHWYEVRLTGKDGKPLTGYVFGNVLTPYRYAADFDGDGEQEIATVALTADFKIRMRILEPSLPPPQRVASAEVSPAGQAYANVRGGPAEALLVGAKRAGVPLIQVDSRSEMCSDYSTTYFSYVVPGAKKGVLGKAKVALKLGGLSDSPAYSDYKVSFQPKQRKLTVVQRSSDGEEDEQVTKEQYQWKDGVYVELKP